MPEASPPLVRTPIFVIAMLSPALHLSALSVDLELLLDDRGNVWAISANPCSVGCRPSTPMYLLTSDRHRGIEIDERRAFAQRDDADLLIQRRQNSAPAPR